MGDAMCPRFIGAARRLGAAGSLAAAALMAAALPGPAVAADPSWHFAVSGDSRNCGDVVMPSIAADARANDAAFYWHLGDARAIYDFDEDFRALHPAATIAEYLGTAWLDFQRNQIEPFGAMPFFLGIGNHELVSPKTREEFVATFADWLDAPDIREQRLKDDVHDHRVRTYYHWTHGGVDFINLDNASPDQFDAAQLKWLGAVLQKDREDPSVRALVVGMHEALPESLARGHSMSDVPLGQATGLDVYGQLLTVQKAKPVYVLASHSHFLMGGIFATPYWRSHGGELPGWIVGTAGAFRYALPPGAAQATLARTHVYGYLLATVSGSGADRGNPIRFEFREVTQAAVPGDVVVRFGAELIRRCYQENAQN
jgi:3',5'-cyclic AMP phosphodiesterase CpdA